MADIGVGVRNNVDGTPSSLPTVDVAPENAVATVDADASEAKMEDKDIMDFLVDMHKSAIKAIEDYKAKVSGSEVKGEKLYSSKEVLEVLESIEDPSKRVSFYKANKDAIGKALIAKSVR